MMANPQGGNQILNLPLFLITLARNETSQECPDKANEHSTPRCCNFTLADGDKLHSSNYRGCSHANDGAESNS
jgi:hypothetical protein